MARTLKLVLAYDGTHYAGWQRQKGECSIQETLEAALQPFQKKKVCVHGSGRTDSGVHAVAQVASVSLDTTLSARTIKKALNATLPKDIAITSVTDASSQFHAQYSAKRKQYDYCIWNTPNKPVFERQFLTHVVTPLDIKAMRQAAKLFLGRHDFYAFHSTGRKVESTVRTILKSQWRHSGHRLTYSVQANGFLYHMVRRMMGVLLEVGKGKYEPDIVLQFLKPRSKLKKTLVAPTAPAQGLFLTKVFYE